MDGREERVARNESTSRDINEDIQEAHDGSDPHREVRMLCECGHESCDRVIAITMAEYERVRGDGRRFVVVRDHVIPDVEDVVEEIDRFLVVRKRDGAPAEVAEEEDPRG